MKRSSNAALFVLALVVAMLAGFAGVLFSPQSAPAAVNPSNLGGVWYRNLAPVNVDMLNPTIMCLVAGGLPPNPILKDDPTEGPNPFPAPADLLWSKGGRAWPTSAVWTYYAPEVAYVEAMRGLFDLTPGQGAINEVRACVDRQRSKVVVVERANPLGDQQPRDVCRERLGVEECWQGNRADQFLPDEEFRDAGVVYRKYRGGWFFFTWSLWARKAEVKLP